MFGYVIPDKLNMYIKDFNVFQSFYCGLCKTLGETGAEFTRLCTNYDVTFYNVLLHSLTNTPVKFERKLCAYNGKKKVVVKTDELSKKIADIAVMLVYYNLEDDVFDGKKSRAVPKSMLAPRKKKAAKRLPEIDEMMKKKFCRFESARERKLRQYRQSCRYLCNAYARYDETSYRHRRQYRHFLLQPRKAHIPSRRR